MTKSKLLGRLLNDVVCTMVTTSEYGIVKFSVTEEMVKNICYAIKCYNEKCNMSKMTFELKKSINLQVHTGKKEFDVEELEEVLESLPKGKNFSLYPVAVGNFDQYEFIEKKTDFKVEMQVIFNEGETWGVFSFFKISISTYEDEFIYVQLTEDFPSKTFRDYMKEFDVKIPIIKGSRE